MVDVDEELKKTKGKKGFQKGNKLASKSVKKNAAMIKQSDLELLKNPQATVVEILQEKGINAAYEMIKAAKRIKNPTDKFRAWRDIHGFIEGQVKATDIRINKNTENKTINITYKSKEDRTKPRKPLTRVVEAEYKELKENILDNKGKLDNEIEEAISYEVDSESDT